MDVGTLLTNNPNYSTPKSSSSSFTNLIPSLTPTSTQPSSGSSSTSYQQPLPSVNNIYNTFNPTSIPIKNHTNNFFNHSTTTTTTLNSLSKYNHHHLNQIQTSPQLSTTSPPTTRHTSHSISSPNDRDTRLEKAVALVNDNKYSVRKAANALCLPKSTVHRYLQATRCAAYNNQQGISKRPRKSLNQNQKNRPEKCGIAFLLDNDDMVNKSTLTKKKNISRSNYLSQPNNDVYNNMYNHPYQTCNSTSNVNYNYGSNTVHAINVPNPQQHNLHPHSIMFTPTATTVGGPLPSFILEETRAFGRSQ